MQVGSQTTKNMTVVSTAADLEQTLRRALTTHKLCVVDWFAPWCHACRSLYPKLRQIAELHTDVLFIKVRLHVVLQKVILGRLR